MKPSEFDNEVTPNLDYHLKFRAYCLTCELMSEVKKLTWMSDVNICSELKCNHETYSTLMKFSSLYDKNGKEIYARDILKFRLDDDEDNIDNIGEVRDMGAGGFWFFSFFSDFCEQLDMSARLGDMDTFIEDYEVIGNMYSNPELLDDTNKGEN